MRFSWWFQIATEVSVEALEADDGKEGSTQIKI